ncbi:hypothetical protein HGM15179_011547 [Zosterops borbonicus]|uniref:Uncharacterized protein n=1 Tax=Zosterops borbonicus TaxID=364589 RepID=A0A8K1LJ54_9PASS|nr:hypothetical protein HGM15179_011547 [Zosterops borbonicus]
MPIKTPGINLSISDLYVPQPGAFDSGAQTCIGITSLFTSIQLMPFQVSGKCQTRSEPKLLGAPAERDKQKIQMPGEFGNEPIKCFGTIRTDAGAEGTKKDSVANFASVLRLPPKHIPVGTERYRCPSIQHRLYFHL